MANTKYVIKSEASYRPRSPAKYDRRKNGGPGTSRPCEYVEDGDNESKKIMLPGARVPMPQPLHVTAHAVVIRDQDPNEKVLSLFSAENTRRLRRPRRSGAMS